MGWVADGRRRAACSGGASGMWAAWRGLVGNPPFFGTEVGRCLAGVGAGGSPGLRPCGEPRAGELAPAELRVVRERLGLASASG